MHTVMDKLMSTDSVTVTGTINDTCLFTNCYWCKTMYLVTDANLDTNKSMVGSTFRFSIVRCFRCQSVDMDRDVVGPSRRLSYKIRSVESSLGINLVISTFGGGFAVKDMNGFIDEVMGTDTSVEIRVYKDTAPTYGPACESMSMDELKSTDLYTYLTTEKCVRMAIDRGSNRTTRKGLRRC